jgi:hypothetical protein
MATGAQMRKLALALPETQEKSHFGQPDFRVRGKIFAGVSPDGVRGTLKLSPAMQATLLDARAEAFSPCAGAWGRSGWTYVKLAKARTAELRFLLEQSWRLVAPKRLVAAHDPKPAAR